MADERHYILMRPLENDDMDYEVGSLWRSTGPTLTTPAGPRIPLIRAEHPKASTTCSVDPILLQEIHWKLHEALQEVAAPDDRLVIAQDPQRMQEVRQLEPGANVTVKLPNGSMTGTVRYAGPLINMPGRRYGVELNREHIGHGTSDGEFRKKRYFTCAKNGGVFVAVHRLRLVNSLRPVSSSPPKECVIVLGDRVVYIDETGNLQSGVARFLGPLPGGDQKTVYAGVEFDEPVGRGNGRYQGHQLFTAAEGHASLIPLLGLMREDDLKGRPRPSTPPSPSTPSPPQNAAALVQRDLLQRFRVGMSVEVMTPPRYGVVHWIGYPRRNVDASMRLVAGLEMETSEVGYTDGCFEGEQLFTCRQGYALFIFLDRLRPDQRMEVERVGRLSGPRLQSDCSPTEQDN